MLTGISSWKSRKVLVNRILKNAPLLVGCLLFIGSIILPFYRFNLVSFIETGTSILYWSFKADIQSFDRMRPLPRDLFTFREFWFLDHWFDYYPSRLGVSWALISIFGIQILALVTGITTIFIHKKVLLFAAVPAVLCPAVTALMVHVNIVLHESTWALNAYQLGYWLTFPCTALFVANFIVKFRFDKGS
ncbi:MAG: hypothetical protein JSV51_01295 [Candidatus Bathyarchaeota archaeon]|nr:MAG: hypothetical protein JSV51_01295 [Candidatus Bathyarchaeota archaeon]